MEDARLSKLLKYDEFKRSKQDYFFFFIDLEEVVKCLTFDVSKTRSVRFLLVPKFTDK